MSALIIDKRARGVRATYSDLTEAVLSWIDEDDRSGAIDVAKDAARYGADAGFAGFTYYTDTCAFFDKNRKMIFAKLSEDSDEFGTTSAAMLKGFRCLDGTRDPLLSLLVEDDETDQVKNALAWYALESAGHELGA